MDSSNSSPKDLLQFFLSQYPNASRLQDMNAWIQMQGGRKPAGSSESFGAQEPEDSPTARPTRDDLNLANSVIRSWRFGGAREPGPEDEAPPEPSPSPMAASTGPTNYHIDMKPSYDSQGHRSWSIKQIFEGK